MASGASQVLAGGRVRYTIEVPVRQDDGDCVQFRVVHPAAGRG